MKILVPIDFTESTDNAMNTGIEFAQKFNAELLFVHVVENEGESAEALKQLEAKINAIDALKGHDHSCLVKAGNLYDQLSALGEESAVNMMLLGTHDSSSISKMMGSKAIRVIGNCTFPIITIKKTDTLRPIKKIVVTLDLVNKSIQIIKHVQVLSTLFGAEVILVGGEQSDSKLRQKSSINAAIARKFLADSEVPARLELLPRRKFVQNLFKFCEDNEVDLLAATFYNDNETVFSVPFIQQLMDNPLGIPTLVIDSVPSTKSGQLAGIIS